MASPRIENTGNANSVAQVAQFSQKEFASAVDSPNTFRAPRESTNVFEKMFNAVRFVASATIGIPAATSAAAFIGSLYMIASATNILETNVKHNVQGDKKVYEHPFYKKTVELLGAWMGKTLTEANYAPLSTYKMASNFIQDHTATGIKVEAFVNQLAQDNPQFKKALQGLPPIAQNSAYYTAAAQNHIPSPAPQSPNGIMQGGVQGRG